MPVLLNGIEKMRGLGLGLSRWTALEVCFVLGEWIEYRLHGLESFAESQNGLVKGLMQVFSVGSAILKEWRKGFIWESTWVVP